MEIKKIAILTSGGDSPGMNTAIQGLVVGALKKNIHPYLVIEGFKGLYEGNFKLANLKTVTNYNYQGGTNILSARFPEFTEEDIRKKALENLKTFGIDALIIIGGDGSYTGGLKLSEVGFKIICLPGTIDNDLNKTDFTIGFFTALDTITAAIDKIRQTSESHNRVAIIETMGRNCGELALYSAIATNAEIISLPEKKLTVNEIVKLVQYYRNVEQKRSIIILITEKLYDAYQLAKEIETKTEIETRATVIGYQQRGGSPQAMDRFLANRMANFAIKNLLDGKSGVGISIHQEKLYAYPLEKILKSKREYKLALINEFYGEEK